jgi:ABC-type branched-subunit amino acid transport system substrate-binding protein
MMRLSRLPGRGGSTRCFTLVAVVVAATSLAACGNAANTVSHSGNSDGVSATSITVGGIASLSGPIPAEFGGVFDGAKAYFDMINAEGGVYGRKIDYSYQLDDASDPSQDVAQARALVSQDHVFSIVGVGTAVFSAASYLVQQDVPTFGYAITPTWSQGNNLFGAEGSFVDFLSPGPEPAFLAQQVHATKVALLAYNVTPSQEACQGFSSVLERYGIHVVFSDLSIPAPAIDLSSQVIRLKAAGAQMVVSCMDLAGNVLLSEALQQAQIHPVQYWLNGYDETDLHQYSKLMQGVYFLVTHTPFQLSAAELARYSGMALYLRELAKYFPNDTPNEASLAGWINADLFVTGLRKLGAHTAPTRSALIAAINGLVNYTADGLVSPITWKDEHDANGPYDCNVYMQVRGGRFVQVFGSPPSAFTCFRYPEPASTRRLVPIAPPPAVPGA